MAIYKSKHTGQKIDDSVDKAHLTGPSDPTTGTVGVLGQRYFNTTTGAIFECTVIAGSVYTWRPVIVNALTETVAGKALDATQGKALRDLISTHEGKFVTSASGVHGLKIEEGLWTPLIVGTTIGGTHTYALQEGKYYKIGKKVTAFFSIKMSAKDGAMAGVTFIAGLPFPADNLDFSQGGSIGSVGNLDMPTNYSGLGLAIQASSSISYISIYGDNVVSDTLPASGITSTTVIRGVLEYKTV